MKILVIGAHGMLGRELVNRLSNLSEIKIKAIKSLV